MENINYLFWIWVMLWCLKLEHVSSSFMIDKDALCFTDQMKVVG